ncbi:hypothetical protein JRO89_XS06G0121500 [Xanthoceras sorbifolium]|uniref:Protein kinase domain-containing protein n=1 Tax=Xanthoceras sorbifolium TaxID=99658 RepID=A0ABQ8HXW3_9ROSI|nr:hypothetical protein JRO89_XS06G0121500 [Xanthoceras sorbifolium]
MGFGLSIILVLALFFKPLACQQPNTDGYFVSEFFKKMTSPSSSSSQASNFSTPVCSWQGVFCDAQKEHVIGLSASGLGLSGSVPDTTIGKLTKLQSLDLSNNKITTLPSDLWSLGSLKTLNLSSNQISGPLPSNIGNFGMLEAFDLSNNNFSGEIPAAISSLVSLRVLKLERNMFQWSIPTEIVDCQSLVSVDLSMNSLNGSLPDGFFGAAFPKLRSLNLAGNEIHGRDPDLSEMKSITSLNISGNLFQGSVMGVFQEQMEVIDLSRNQFQGHISQVQFNTSFNWSHLVYLDLSENQLSGEIFNNLNRAHNLKHLNLAYNRFNRQEFPRIETFLALEYLNLSRTSLAGLISNDISQLSSLHTLDLSMNHLTGQIPLLSIKSLEIVDVSHNNLSGEIPVSVLDKLPWMERFNFSFNNLTLCASELSPEILQTAFFGSTNNCPIAANPGLFKRREAKHKGLKLALALTLSMICLLAGLLFLAFGCRRKPKMWAVKTNLIQRRAKYFRDLLAEGKFGPVYRGFLPGGIHVAVKVLVHGSTLTDQEAARELEYLGRIKHPNLVPLTGYCLAGDQRIAIYDYMENGNLQNFLYDLPLGFKQQKIGARIHGKKRTIMGSKMDIKASSVYLDFNLEPRVSDFGLAKVFGSGLDDEIARGSPGYVPPEFSQPECDSPTPKSDVYCFGVVLFELVTGKKPIEDDYPEEKEANLVSWVRGLLRKNQGSKAIDPKIRDTGPENQMEEALKIGYLCTADLPSKRPSMQQIVGLLKDIEPTSHQ